MSDQNTTTTIAQGDAALFAGLPSGGGDDDDETPDTEDPVSRGQTKAQALDAFRAATRLRPVRPGVRGGNIEPLPYVRLTPGAHLVP